MEKILRYIYVLLTGWAACTILAAKLHQILKVDLGTTCLILIIICLIILFIMIGTVKSRRI